MMNLVYYFLATHLEKEKLEEIDKALERAARQGEPEATRPKKSRVPSWWKGDAAATASTMMAASQLGVTPQGE